MCNQRGSTSQENLRVVVVQSAVEVCMTSQFSHTPSHFHYFPHDVNWLAVSTWGEQGKPEGSAWGGFVCG